MSTTSTTTTTTITIITTATTTADKNRLDVFFLQVTALRQWTFRIRTKNLLRKRKTAEGIIVRGADACLSGRRGGECAW